MGTDPHTAPAGRTLRALSTDIADDVIALVRLEFQLAQAQLQEKGQVGGAAAALGVGAVALGTVCGLVLVAALILVLSEVMPPWAAALVVAALLAIAAAVAAAVARSLARRAGAIHPADSIEHARRDLQWLRQHSR